MRPPVLPQRTLAHADLCQMVFTYTASFSLNKTAFDQTLPPPICKKKLCLEEVRGRYRGANLLLGAFSLARREGVPEELAKQLEASLASWASFASCTESSMRVLAEIQRGIITCIAQESAYQV